MSQLKSIYQQSGGQQSKYGRSSDAACKLYIYKAELTLKKTGK